MMMRRLMPSIAWLAALPLSAAVNAAGPASGYSADPQQSRLEFVGVQAGADWQFNPNFVVGVEGQYSWLSGSVGAVFPGGIAYTNDQRGLGSITGRVGYTWGPGLVYVKGGYAYSDNRDTLTLAGVPVAFSLDTNHRDGYTIGAGVEYMFAPNWSAKAEYQYYNFGNTTFTTGPADIAGRSFRHDEHTAKVGVNYRFGWGGPAASRY